MRIIDYFDVGVRSYPNNVAFIDIAEGAQGVTYSDASIASHVIGGAIRGHGYAKGAHIGILAPNCTSAFSVLLGLFRSEGIWLPINPRNPVPINMDLLERFDCELLFFHSSYANEAEQLMHAIPEIREAVCIDAATPTRPSIAQWSKGCPSTLEVGVECADDVFAINPTGGTTGKSKGVIVSHRNMEAMFANFYSHFQYYDDARHLVVAPMTHAAGIFSCLHFARGGTNLILHEVSPSSIIDSIEKLRITHLFLPPTVLYMILALPNVTQKNYASLKHFLIGAAPTSVEKLKEAITVFGPVMTEAFGQSEAPAAIALKAPWDYLDSKGKIIESRLQSIGRACVHNQVVLLNDEGQVVPTGQPGEICIRGALVTPGYYKNPEATAEVRQFGWHHTGDVGIIDCDGFITVVDRKKDMIITGGFNVYPNEVEQVLMSHEAVQDCAVIGVPDEKWGESIKAVVQLKPLHNVSADELMALVKDVLGSVKAPKSVDFMVSLPRSPAGKVLKMEIRKTYWSKNSRLVA
jgi:acyl-CoA synthetase (AMP-forming)/AMP-acid ligase II